MNKNEVHLEIPHVQMTKQALANKKVAAKAFKSLSKHKIEQPDHWFGSKNIILRLFQLIMPLKVTWNIPLNVWKTGSLRFFAAWLMTKVSLGTLIWGFEGQIGI
jgi:hypothetical protein